MMSGVTPPSHLSAAIRLQQQQQQCDHQQPFPSTNNTSSLSSSELERLKINAASAYYRRLRDETTLSQSTTMATSLSLPASSMSSSLSSTVPSAHVAMSPSTLMHRTQNQSLARVMPPSQNVVAPSSRVSAPVAPLNSFSQHWIMVGHDLKVLLLDFPLLNLSLLVPNATMAFCDERASILRNNGNLLHFTFVSPPATLTATVLPDRNTAYVALKNNSPVVILERILSAMITPNRTRSQSAVTNGASSLTTSQPQQEVQSPSLMNTTASIEALTQPEVNDSEMSKTEKVAVSEPQSHLRSENEPSDATNASMSTASELSEQCALATTLSETNSLSEKMFARNVIAADLYPALRNDERTQLLTCRYCGRQLFFVSEHLAHMKKHTSEVTKVAEMWLKIWVQDRKLRCHICTKSKKSKFSYTLDYALHMDEHCLDNFFCELCDEDLKSPAEYSQHMQIHHASVIFAEANKETHHNQLDTNQCSTSIENQSQQNRSINYQVPCIESQSTKAKSNLSLQNQGNEPQPAVKQSEQDALGIEGNHHLKVVEKTLETPSLMNAQKPEDALTYETCQQENSVPIITNNEQSMTKSANKTLVELEKVEAKFPSGLNVLHKKSQTTSDAVFPTPSSPEAKTSMGLSRVSEVVEKDEEKSCKDRIKALNAPQSEIQTTPDDKVKGIEDSARSFENDRVENGVTELDYNTSLQPEAQIECRSSKVRSEKESVESFAKQSTLIRPTLDIEEEPKEDANEKESPIWEPNDVNSGEENNQTKIDTRIIDDHYECLWCDNKFATQTSINIHLRKCDRRREKELLETIPVHDSFETDLKDQLHDEEDHEDRDLKVEWKRNEDKESIDRTEESNDGKNEKNVSIIDEDEQSQKDSIEDNFEQSVLERIEDVASIEDKFSEKASPPYHKDGEHSTEESDKENYDDESKREKENQLADTQDEDSEVNGDYSHFNETKSEQENDAFDQDGEPFRLAYKEESENESCNEKVEDSEEEIFVQQSECDLLGNKDDSKDMLVNSGAHGNNQEWVDSLDDGQSIGEDLESEEVKTNPEDVNESCDNEMEPNNSQNDIVNENEAEEEFCDDNVNVQDHFQAPVIEEDCKETSDKPEGETEFGYAVASNSDREQSEGELCTNGKKEYSNAKAIFEELQNTWERERQSFEEFESIETKKVSHPEEPSKLKLKLKIGSFNNDVVEHYVKNKLDLEKGRKSSRGRKRRHRHKYDKLQGLHEVLEKTPLSESQKVAPLRLKVPLPREPIVANIGSSSSLTSSLSLKLKIDLDMIVNMGVPKHRGRKRKSTSAIVEPNQETKCRLKRRKSEHQLRQSSTSDSEKEENEPKRLKALVLEPKVSAAKQSLSSSSSSSSCNVSSLHWHLATLSSRVKLSHVQAMPINEDEVHDKGEVVNMSTLDIDLLHQGRELRNTRRISFLRSIDAKKKQTAKEEGDSLRHVLISIGKKYKKKDNRAEVNNTGIEQYINQKLPITFGNVGDEGMVSGKEESTGTVKKDRSESTGEYEEFVGDMKNKASPISRSEKETLEKESPSEIEKDCEMDKHENENCSTIHQGPNTTFTESNSNSNSTEGSLNKKEQNEESNKESTKEKDSTIATEETFAINKDQGLAIDVQTRIDTSDDDKFDSEVEEKGNNEGNSIHKISEEKGKEMLEEKDLEDEKAIQENIFVEESHGGHSRKSLHSPKIDKGFGNDNSIEDKVNGSNEAVVKKSELIEGEELEDRENVKNVKDSEVIVSEIFKEFEDENKSSSCTQALKNPIVNNEELVGKEEVANHASSSIEDGLDKVAKANNVEKTVDNKENAEENNATIRNQKASEMGENFENKRFTTKVDKHEEGTHEEKQDVLSVQSKTVNTLDQDVLINKKCEIPTNNDKCNASAENKEDSLKSKNEKQTLVDQTGNMVESSEVSAMSPSNEEGEKSQQKKKDINETEDILSGTINDELPNQEQEHEVQGDCNNKASHAVENSASVDENELINVDGPEFKNTSVISTVCDTSPEEKGNADGANAFVSIDSGSKSDKKVENSMDAQNIVSQEITAAQSHVASSENVSQTDEHVTTKTAAPSQSTSRLISSPPKAATAVSSEEVASLPETPVERTGSTSSSIQRDQSKNQKRRSGRGLGLKKSDYIRRRRRRMTHGMQKLNVDAYKSEVISDQDIVVEEEQHESLKQRVLSTIAEATELLRRAQEFIQNEQDHHPKLVVQYGEATEMISDVINEREDKENASDVAKKKEAKESVSHVVQELKASGHILDVAREPESGHTDSDEVKEAEGTEAVIASEERSTEKTICTQLAPAKESERKSETIQERLFKEYAVSDSMRHQSFMFLRRPRTKTTPRINSNIVFQGQSQQRLVTKPGVNFGRYVVPQPISKTTSTESSSITKSPASSPSKTSLQSTTSPASSLASASTLPEQTSPSLISRASRSTAPLSSPLSKKCGVDLSPPKSTTQPSQSLMPKSLKTKSSSFSKSSSSKSSSSRLPLSFAALRKPTSSPIKSSLDQVSSSALTTRRRIVEKPTEVDSKQIVTPILHAIISSLKPMQQPPETWLQPIVDELVTRAVKQVERKRGASRAKKNWDSKDQTMKSVEKKATAIKRTTTKTTIIMRSVRETECNDPSQFDYEDALDASEMGRGKRARRYVADEDFVYAFGASSKRLRKVTSL